MRLEIHVRGPDAETRVVPLEGEAYVGRDEGNAIRLESAQVSRRHARIRKAEGGVWVEDLGSRNGVLFRGRRLEAPMLVPEGESVVVGPFELCVRRVQRASGEVESSVRNALVDEVIAALDLRRLEVESLSEEELRRRTLEAIDRIVEAARAEGRIPPGAVEGVRREIADEVLGLGPLEALLADDGVTEILVNGPGQIYVEREGRLMPTPTAFASERALLAVIERIAARVGRRIDAASPMVDARLPDGSRVCAVIPPLSLTGPCLTIRKFRKERLGLDALVERGALSTAMRDFFALAVRARRNVVISGGTGSGKTTLLNALTEAIGDDERILTVEDAAELQIRKPHWVRFEARPPNLEGKGAIAIRDLVRTSLRMRPDRIVVGECRGGEALDMLQAMNTGHDGSLTTLHANSPRDALARLETLCLMSGMDLPSRAIREQIASAIHLVVQVARFSDGRRRITSIAEVVGMEGERISLQEIFVWDRGHRATGFVPRFCERMREQGEEVDLSLFRPCEEGF
ncbi:MAG TPA: ATPase, T2SS/T4P/T4SS family [Fredinandcohnia sp.]|nr:ATPase, T2SS/T4P/T4SS family [Fredinandcohnia sp.]